MRIPILAWGIGEPTRHPRWHGSAPVTGTPIISRTPSRERCQELPGRRLDRFQRPAPPARAVGWHTTAPTVQHLAGGVQPPSPPSPPIKARRALASSAAPPSRPPGAPGCVDGQPLPHEFDPDGRAPLFHREMRMSPGGSTLGPPSEEAGLPPRGSRVCGCRSTTSRPRPSRWSVR